MLPIRFEYVERCTDIEFRRFVTVLGEYTHHYTGEKFFRIRSEMDIGTIQEYMVTEADMKQMLSKRVEV